MHTYAVMGVNTALIQAALMSRARVHTILPAKMEARFDMIKGNFKIQALPVPGIDKIASAVYVHFLFEATCMKHYLFSAKTFFPYCNSVETLAIARNVEDLAAAKITPMIPAPAAISFTSKFTSNFASSMASSMVSLIAD